MAPGPMPVPAAAPPTVVFDEVTNGYVPRSMSSIAPCAPSNSTLSPRALQIAQHFRHVDDERLHALAEAQQVVELAPRLDALGAVVIREQEVVQVEQPLELRFERARREQVGDADARAARSCPRRPGRCRGPSCRWPRRRSPARAHDRAARASSR